MVVSILTLASFVKVFHSVFMGPPLPGNEQVREAPRTMLIGMTILAAIVIISGIFPEFFVQNLITPSCSCSPTRQDTFQQCSEGHDHGICNIPYQRIRDLGSDLVGASHLYRPCHSLDPLSSGRLHAYKKGTEQARPYLSGEMPEPPRERGPHQGRQPLLGIHGRDKGVLSANCWIS